MTFIQNVITVYAKIVLALGLIIAACIVVPLIPLLVVVDLIVATVRRFRG